MAQPIFNNSRDWLDNITAYYVNLLIMQYHQKTKARATLATLARPIFEDLFELENAFDLEIAEGKQLDILGEWVGIPRNLFGVDLDKIYYELSDSGALSDTPISTAQQLSSAIFKRYRSRYNSIYTLNDVQMRMLIKLKIMYNMTQWTTANLDELYATFFGDSITRQDNFDMTVTVTINDATNMLVFLIANQKNYLPKGMGVKYIIQYLHLLR